MRPLQYVFKAREFFNQKDWERGLQIIREGLTHYPDDTQLQRYRLMCRLILEGPETALANNRDEIDDETGERLKKWLIAQSQAGDVADYEEDAWAKALLSIFDDTAGWKDHPD